MFKFNDLTLRLKELFRSLQKVIERRWINFLSRKNRKTKYVRWADYFLLFAIGVWQVIIGIAFEMSERLKSSLWQAYNVITTDPLNFYQYSVDIPVLIFVVVSIGWSIFFLRSIIYQDRETTKKFRKIQATILKAPDFNIYRDARIYFSYTYDMLLQVERDLTKLDYQQMYYSALESEEMIAERMEILSIALSIIHKSTINLAHLFFHRSKIEGANFMLFFENNEINSQVINRLLEDTESLYLRPAYDTSMRGILFLVPDLVEYSETANYLRDIPSLVLPVYDPSKRIYNGRNYMGKEVIIPGAILALQYETSMVGDTLDTDEFYYELDEFTQNEIRNYFGNSGKDVKSFASFRIPDPDAPQECIGILNLDSSFVYSFGEDGDFFDTFYTIIYPTLTVISKYLIRYREEVSKVLTVNPNYFKV